MDILIVGFPCVDFSPLNTHKKKLVVTKLSDKPKEEAAEHTKEQQDDAPEKVGQSSVTFTAIKRYVEKYRPAVIIVENVLHAPWQMISAEFENIEYTAAYTTLDTRNFLLPQTRQRGYMICINNRVGEDLGGLRQEEAKSRILVWIDVMSRLQRRANVSAEHFLLPADHPALVKSIKSQAGPKTSADWSVCAGRHKRERFHQQIGDGTPYTSWSKGHLVVPAYADRRWIRQQPERVKDCLDISCLKHAYNGDDFEYRLHLPDLSQNIDRGFEPKKPGVVGCVTPNGIIFVSLRGGPLAGLEALGFQGLPISQIEAPRETQTQLKDLAGNAMSTTVIGAAILATLIAAHDAFPADIEPDTRFYDNNNGARSLVERELPMIPVLLTHKPDEVAFSADLFHLANSTRIKCGCEANLGVTLPVLLQCTGCSAIVCSKCHGQPKHVDNWDSPQLTRRQPQEFKNFVGKALPTKLFLDIQISVSTKYHAQMTGTNDDPKSVFLSAMLASLGEELYYQNVTRSTYWTIRYESRRQILLLVIGPKGMTWLLFVKLDNDQAIVPELQKLSSHPVARCIVRSRNIFEGDWELRIPQETRLPGYVEGVGELVPSWKSRLGITANGSKDEKVWSKLELRFQDDQSDPRLVPLAGTYTLLPHCGTANGSLHRKDSGGPSSCDKRSLFLFLDPARYGDPNVDEFVIADDHSRLGLNDSREVLARIVHRTQSRTVLPVHLKPKGGSSAKQGSGESIRQSKQQHAGANKAKKGKQAQQIKQRIAGTKDGSERRKGPAKNQREPCQWRPSSLHTQLVDIVIDEKWQRCEADFRPSTKPEKGEILERGASKVGFGTATGGSCRDVVSIKLFAGEIPWYGRNPDGRRAKAGCTIDETNQKAMVLHLQWLGRMIGPLLSDAKSWMKVENANSELACHVCVPSKPAIKWKRAEKKRGNAKRKWHIIPYEDPGEATLYEFSTKNLPSPFSIKLLPHKPSSKTRAIEIRLIIQATIHRLEAIILEAGGRQNKDKIKADWRIMPELQPVPKMEFSSFILSSNEKDVRVACHFPGTNYYLRPEQQRSFSWMRSREAVNCAPYRVMIIDEVWSDHLQWGIEVRAYIDIPKRGGILNDEVGYGKTPLTLALIRSERPNSKGDDAMMDEVPSVPTTPTPLIPTQATLIIVPPTLVSQWVDEIHKFCKYVKWEKGNPEPVVEDFRVVVLKSVQDFEQTTIAQVVEADIVVVSLSVLNPAKTPEYLEWSAFFAGLPSPPKFYTFHEYRLWDNYIGPRTVENLQSLKTMNSMEALGDFLEGQIRGFRDSSGIYYDTASERRRAQASVDKRRYHSQGASLGTQLTDNLEKEETVMNRFRRIAGFETASSFDELKCAPLHLFLFKRKVIDEQSYLDGYDILSIKRIHALSIWLLSGTPQIRDLVDVYKQASLFDVPICTFDDLENHICRDSSEDIRKNRTQVEIFEELSASKSPSWHQKQCVSCQYFLNFFARQNRPQVGEIATKTEVKPILMSPLNECFYLELQAQLTSGNANYISADLQGYRAHSRNKLLMPLLHGSESYDEALLRAAFILSGNGELLKHRIFKQINRSLTWESLISERELDRFTAHWEEILNIKAVTLYICQYWMKYGSQVRFEREKGPDKEQNEAFIRCYSAFTTELDKYYGDITVMAAVRAMKATIAATKIGIAPGTGMDDSIQELLAVIRTLEEPETTAKAAQDKKKKGKEALDEQHYENDRIKGLDTAGAQAKTIQELDEDDQVENVSHLRIRETVDEITKLDKALLACVAALRFSNILRLIECSSLPSINKDPFLRLGSACKHTITESAGFAINTQCGHICCTDCHGMQSQTDRCSETCNSPTIPTNWVFHTDIRAREYETHFEFSNKTDAIVKAIKSTPDEEQILVFSQFPEFSDTLVTAFRDTNINFKYVKETDQTAARSLESFRKAKPGESKWLKVLMLNPMNAIAAGHNLQNVSVVIYVSPLFAESKHESMQAYTQSLGRARRFGQTSVVKVWHFIVLNTVEVNIFEELHGEEISKMIHDKKSKTSTSALEFASRPYRERFRDY